MSNIKYFIGLDIACDDFAASIYQSPETPAITKEAITNNPDGFNMLISWLKSNNISKSNSIVCMEATGVYSKAVTNYLVAEGFNVCVEPPLKVKRAFDPCGHKTDAVDSKQIAEYAYRYHDELNPFKPKDEILEKVRQLLAARERFRKQSTAIRNAAKAYKREPIKVDLIVNAHMQTLNQLKKHIADIDKELNKLTRQNPVIFQNTNILKSIPGCGMLLSANILAITGNFENIKDHKQLAAFIGIVPYKHQSGTSIHKKPRTRGFGPQITRKLLKLAAWSIATHNKDFRQYYLRKLAEGKHKGVIFNNIANKLIKIACAMVRDNKSYIKEHCSIHPMCLKVA
jgi:transposase